ncbi:MAG: polysaccharide pyruvyl transferase family protein [Candidatus Calescibacterium sp.]|nr:polysaccharide pyruvyl transferase family protein [Candidatus Calescibacterium sp.]MDW8132254.1 polysaccharide pyruvyl transferase family protein [Candidatus Calescibacterium sp.]
MFDSDIKEVCIIGYYGFGNIGDDAILIAALEEYTKAYDMYVRILVNKNDYVERMLKEFHLNDNIVLYDRWNIGQIAESIHYSDALIFCGGGLFQDKTSLKSFMYYFFLAFLAHLKKKKIIIERNSIGPLNTKVSRFLFSKVLNWASTVSVRDTISYNFLVQNYPEFSLKYRIKQDFVMSDISSNIFKRSVSKEKNYDILFILRKSQGIEQIADLINQIKNEYSLRVIVFQEGDLFVLKDIIQNVDYPGPGKIYETLEIIQSSRVVVSNRLHGLIMAFMNDIKTIGISTDPKIEGFCKDYNLDYLCDNDYQLKDKLISLLKVYL